MQRDGGPGGAGGAGNPTGGSFTGPAEAIEIIGDHAYAMSGPIDAEDGSYVTHLSFQTGNYYLVGSMDFYGGTIDDDPFGGTMCLFKVQYNGVVVFTAKTSANPEAMPPYAHCPVIIPSYTEIIVAARSGAEGGGIQTFASISGRIYRG